MTTAVEFITSAFSDCLTHEEPRPITLGQAARMIKDWTEDGAVEIPPTIDPLTVSRTWNILCGKHMAAHRTF